MPSAKGIEGVIRIDNDFTSQYVDVVWGTGVLVSNAFDPFGFSSDDEGSFASTVDEPGGILAITTDVGDDDSAVLFGGAFFARDGGCRMGARFKYSNVDCAIMVGFQETISLTAPVMGLEFATATMTYGNVGNVAGFNYDVDGTTDDFRGALGDAQAAKLDSSNGHRANATVTADRWFEGEIDVKENGGAELWLSDLGHIDGDSVPQLRLIKDFRLQPGTSNANTGLNTTDPIMAMLMIENRTGNARVLEVDYMWAEGHRDRRPT